RLARELERLGKGRFKRPAWKTTLEFILALTVALILATIIRQSWFELYEIPTGSMRPTYKEQDRLIVSKTTHGLNVPLQTAHFTFIEDQVKRGNVVIWSGDGVDLPDTDSSFLGIFPYKKRYIKRLIGKPGDTLYFYGGKVYGIDKDGAPIRELLDAPYMQEIETVPFISFEGKPEVQAQNSTKELVYKHFNQPVGRVVVNLFAPEKGEIWNGKEWTNRGAFAQRYGIGNYAMVTLVTQEEGKAPYALLFHFNPNLNHAGSQLRARKDPLQTETVLMPLQENDLKKILANLYTSRFVVENGKAYAYSGGSGEKRGGIALSGIPDGTYEFDRGVAYQIHMTGVATRLPKEHPLYRNDPDQIMKLFNYGIRFHPMRGDLQPRFAYYRNGTLYLMGQPFLEKEDPRLKNLSFTDAGEPSKELIEAQGLHIPEGHYLVLGDNHADSGDSRFFGFVPEANLQGTPAFTFWPPGKGWGAPKEAATKLLTSPLVIVWILFLVSLMLWLAYRHRQLTTPVYRKLK
ncbi:MAG: signal peptidase I, partial [Chlamydiia bacterium]|nr:signal peptidase I [Chlamydiia bacterium]